MKTVLVIISVVAAVFMGCVAEPPARNPIVVARVGEATLTLDELNLMVGSQEMGDVSADTKRTAIERWVNRELLYQAGVREGVERNPDVQQRIDWAKKELVAHAFLARRSTAELEVTDEEVARYYEDHKLRFARSRTEVHVAKIVVGDRTLARDLYRQLRRGADFASLAREYSRDPSSEDGGDQGFVTPSVDWDPDLWSRFSQAAEGQILEPVRTSQGHEIYNVIEKRLKGTPRELADVQLEIVNRIRATKEWNRKTEIVERLKIESDYSLDLSPFGSPEWEELSDTLGTESME